MAIARVQGNGTDAGSVTSAGLVFTANVTAGSLLIVAVRQLDGQTVTVTDNLNAGNYTQANHIVLTADTAGTYVFYKENAAAGATTVTVTMSGTSRLRFAIDEFSGLITSSAFDQTAGAYDSNAASTTPNSGATPVTTQAAELIYGAAFTGGTTVTFTQGATYTMAVDGSLTGQKVATEYKVVAATATYTADFTITPAVENSCIVASFKAPSIVIQPASLMGQSCL